jgi:hypothetical protein
MVSFLLILGVHALLFGHGGLLSHA